MWWSDRTDDAALSVRKLLRQHFFAPSDIHDVVMSFTDLPDQFHQLEPSKWLRLIDQQPAIAQHDMEAELRLLVACHGHHHRAIECHIAFLVRRISFMSFLPTYEYYAVACTMQYAECFVVMFHPSVFARALRSKRDTLFDFLVNHPKHAELAFEELCKAKRFVVLAHPNIVLRTALRATHAADGLAFMEQLSRVTLGLRSKATWEDAQSLFREFVLDTVLRHNNVWDAEDFSLRFQTLLMGSSIDAADVTEMFLDVPVSFGPSDKHVAWSVMFPHVLSTSSVYSSAFDTAHAMHACGLVHIIRQNRSEWTGAIVERLVRENAKHASIIRELLQWHADHTQRCVVELLETLYRTHATKRQRLE